MKIFSKFSVVVCTFFASIILSSSIAHAGGGELPPLAIAKGCTTPAKPGDIVQCDIQISNTTKHEYWEVRLFDGYPPELIPMSVSPECRINAGNITCSWKSIKKHKNIAIWFKFQVAPHAQCGKTVMNQADIQAKHAKPNWAKAPIQIICKPKTQCVDGIDNDGDGWVDLDDCGCPTPDGNNEADTSSPRCKKPQCRDGIDNDGDGWIDMEDCGCVTPDGDNEADTSSPRCKKPQCKDGIDNDGDGWIDMDDCGCVTPEGNSEANTNSPRCKVPECRDGIDNDGDGWVDLDDCGCLNPNGESEANTNSPRCKKPQCKDGIDNDGDGWVDTDDCGCVTPDGDNEANTNSPLCKKPQCRDGKDNDGDGWIDLDDCGCVTADGDNEANTNSPKCKKPQCRDGIDNDGDGWVDLEDCGCVTADGDNEADTSSPKCKKPQCSDGIDNDGDGKIDFPKDPGCDNPQDDDEWNQVTSPVLPHLECVYDLGNGKFRAYFGYENTGTTAVNIPAGTNTGGQINMFIPAPADRGQPSSFTPGRKVATFSVEFDGSPLTWKIQPTGATLNSITASSASKACRPVVPIAECADKKPGGKLQALFGYQNDNPFEIQVNIGTQNRFTPPPEDRGQPNRFFPGRVKNAFSVSGEGQFAWILGTKEAWVDGSTPPCTANTAPTCNAGGAYQSQCQGNSAKIFLDGSASRDPEGLTIGYKWSTDCIGGTIDNPTAAKPTLTIDTTSGQAMSCNVTLQVTDGINDSTCSQPVSVAACSKDCAGVPNGGGKVDQCGVCNGNNACLDCAGVPNGGARIDRCGVCGGNDTCVDCAGVPNGSAVLDDCGVCGGDGSQCRQCTTSDISNILLALDIAVNKLKNLCNRVGKRVASAPNATAKIKKAATDARKQCEALYQEAWTTIWTQIPSKIVNCASARACAEVDLSARTASVTSLSASIRDIVLQLSRQAQNLLKKARRPTNAEKKATQEANTLHETTLTAVAQVPRFTSACN